MLPEPLAVTLQVVEVLESLSVPYWIGGSLASAFYGVARSTLDSDLVAQLKPEQVESFVSKLEPAFFVDVEMILDAILHQGSFNIIHRDSMFKVDVFILKARPFEQAQLERRLSQTVSIDPERVAYVCTPEDIILAKLEWYRLGGEVSERQWRDIIGVLKVQSGRLEIEYIRRWAVFLGVSQLLERAIAESSN
jgi:hypothetical protein